MRPDFDRSPSARATPSRVVACGAALLILAALVPAPAAAVVRTCGADALANTRDVLCASGTCTPASVRVTVAFEITSGGCEFDLGGRSLTIERNLQVNGSGWFIVRNAGDVTVTATGRIKARGDFVRPNGFIIGGGVIGLVSAGTITVEGGLDVSGDGAGTIRLDAVGDVLLRPGSSVTANGISSSADEGEKFADGGSLDLVAHTGSVLVQGDVSLTGSNQAQGGIVDVTAGCDFLLTRSLDISGGGSDGGELAVSAGDHITIRAGIDARSRVGGGYGGLISLAAGEDGLGGVVLGGTIDVDGASLILQGSATDTFGGDGGELDVTSWGRVRFFGAGVAIRADAATNFDGSAGSISIDTGDELPHRLGPTDGDLALGGVVTLRSGALGGDGGSVALSAGRDLLVTAAIDAGGTDAGGDLTGDAGRAVTLAGTLSTQGLTAQGDGGFVDFTAGLASDQGGLGMLTVQKDVLGVGGSANGSGQSITLAGCGLEVANNVKIDGSAGVDPNGQKPGGSAIELVARRAMRIGAGVRLLALPAGTVTTVHPPGQSPVIGNGVIFQPERMDQTIESGPYPGCAVCGDGVRQTGEACDPGSGADGACCSATCTAFLCVTPTPTPTVVATRTASATRTATPLRTTPPPPSPATAPTPSHGASPASTSTSTPAFVTTATPTATTTPTVTPTATLIVTTSPTPTVTPSAAPTAAPGTVDHYLCYATAPAPGLRTLRQSVHLADAFERKQTTVVRPSELCVPVDLDGRGLADAEANLQCFTIRDAAGEPRFRARTTTVADTFGTRSLTLRKSERVCAPALRDGATSPLRLDAYKCYTAKPPAGTPRFAKRTLDLLDAFGSHRAVVRGPASVCSAVGRDGLEPRVPGATLHCYDLKRTGQPRIASRSTDVASEFGIASVAVRRPVRLCLSSEVPGAPVCGDGRLAPGEHCDDGNAVAGDGCSPVCTLESCGNGVVEPGEGCDAGSANGHDDCCGADCRPVDPDGDGVCSRDDVCPDDADNDGDADGFCVGASFRPPAVGGGDPCVRPAAAAWEAFRFVVQGLQQSLATQRLTLGATFTVPSAGGAIDPATRGMRVRLADEGGLILLDERLPPLPFTAAGGVGWKRRGTATPVWVFADKRPGRRIGKVIVRDRGARLPGLVEVAVTASGFAAPVPSTLRSLLLGIDLDTLGDPLGEACAETRLRFGDAPECARTARALTCRRR